MEQLKKVCLKCGEEKELSLFYNNKSSKNGKSSQCISCHKEFYENNKDRLNKNNKEYRKNNKEKVNKQLVISRAKYAEKYPERVKESKDKYVKKNIVKLRKKQLETYHENSTEIKNKRNLRNKTDADYRLKNNLTSGFHSSINKKSIKPGVYKFKDICGDVAEYVNILKLSKHWEDFKQNEPISIDHIIPMYYYDFKIKNDILKCWNIRNIRLLPLIENFKKNKRIDIELIKKHKIMDLLPDGMGL